MPKIYSQQSGESSILSPFSEAFLSGRSDIELKTRLRSFVLRHSFGIRHSRFVNLLIVHLWSLNSKNRFRKRSKKLSRKVFSKPSESSRVHKMRILRSPAA